LIVDDEPANLLLLGQVLSTEHRVIVASSGPRAIELATQPAPPDLILLDIMMPVMDGYDVLKTLRANPATAAIPVIFVTARTSVQDETEGLQLGAQDYITKPINPSIVLARVRTQIEAKFARDILTGQNAWLEREVARRLRETRIVGDCTIETLASLAEVHDEDTGLHIRRTQAYVSLLVDRLAGHPRFRDALVAPRGQLIVRAAPLHDIGKVAIPTEILAKPARLTPDEFAVIQTHTTVGAHALNRAVESTLALANVNLPDAIAHREVDEAAVAFLRVASEIALTHHEKWDGTGYPSGLAGDAIPVPGRLMALADVFDALTSPRVYKPALSRDQIDPILREGSGTHFDPDICAVYFHDPAAFHAIATRLADPAGHEAALGHDPSLPGLVAGVHP
jgi:putative two-component system response regulator